ncbi:hypothetical protein Ddye_001119 [Dipteronia dyeriana]|uniref:non-specific serine/threonine protein kinase n=1 Tax=Dipteronia dyeriana TaxID=168575 RepID=A0AAE0CT04_9ROSI|nr:hypothetical protein Ddye_001119 [Dipteronia dyeriana]
MMGLRIQVFLLSVWFQFLIISAVTNTDDAAALKSLKDIWKGLPPNWRGSDPCGDQWVGIECSGSRVTTITLSSMGLSGSLSGDITGLSDLMTLDLSYNKDLRGPLPSSIGNLNKLTNLILVGCSLSGSIPDSIGSLQKLVFLSLNSNGFSGKIPASIGRLTELYWLDLADNQLEGTIPVSDGVSPGLDLLVRTKHFHLGKNKLSGGIPEKLFSSDMVLIHVLFDSNQLTGPLPFSLGLVKTLEVVRFDGNSLSGTVPSNLNNLTNVQELFLSNNRLTGPMPNLTNLNTLSYLDMSNNTFDASTIPSWFSTLQSLTTLTMERTELQGEVPDTVFSLSHLQTVNLKQNRLNGTLDIGTSHSSQLQSINLQKNLITAFTDRPGANKDITILLAGNPICLESGDPKDYCTASEKGSPYTTPSKNCVPTSCSSGRISSPNCICAYPYTGIIHFRAPSFSGVGNETYYQNLEQTILVKYQSVSLPVESVSLSNPRKGQSQYLEISLAVFPSGQDSFNRTGISRIGFVLSNQTYKPPKEFGPFFFIGNGYLHFNGETRKSENSTSIGVIIGAAAGGCVLLLLLVLAGVYAYRQKRRAEKANDQNPFAHWDLNKSSGSIPQLKGARCFSFEELNKCTNHFSDTNNVGSGGYGKVYRATLPSGQLIAIKRAKQGSMQGAVEFKNEIELLSRVHHKNLVSLLGFCFERGEQMLIYEYIPNGCLRDSLSGKSGIRLEWLRRLKIAHGTARGLSYLHELADPPIIHRDVKSTNILLDEQLTAKVADFGVSKPMGDSDNEHITSQVKGTMGYMDPEYFMTNQLTEKSDVYSFGVLMLEILTGRRPIERGKYIVREIKMAMDKKKDLYNLYEILDPTIGLGTTLEGFEKFVDLAFRCVEESGADRPSMREVVKEIENILQLAGLNPNEESAPFSASYDDASKGYQHPYDNESFDYSGGFPASKIEAQ